MAYQSNFKGTQVDTILGNAQKTIIASFSTEESSWDSIIKKGSFEGLFSNFKSSDGSTSFYQLIKKLSKGIASGEPYSLVLIVKWTSQGDIVNTFAVSLDYLGSENSLELNILSSYLNNETLLLEVACIDCNNLQNESYEISGAYKLMDYKNLEPPSSKIVTNVVNAIEELRNGNITSINTTSSPNGVSSKLTFVSKSSFATVDISSLQNFQLRIYPNNYKESTIYSVGSLAIKDSKGVWYKGAVDIQVMTYANQIVLQGVLTS